VLLVVGDPLGDVTTGGYSLIEAPDPRQDLIHVHPEPRELGRVFAPTISVLSDSAAFFEAIEPLDGGAWADATAQARAEQEAWSVPEPGPWQLDLGLVARQAAERLAGVGIVVGDAGNFSVWVSRYADFRCYPSQLMPQSGAMGYAVPAAVAAKLRHPERPVVCFVGDGGFQMSGLELVTAAQERAEIVVIVVNNAMYGTIRMHQERRYPGRVVATGLHNPDFVALARACGAEGELVERTDQFMPALERALAADRSTLLELRTSAEAISPSETISSIRAGRSGEPAAG
jgi:acetolactate synthase-1/2/3 large subunit